MRYLLILITLLLTACTPDRCEDPVPCLNVTYDKSTTFALLDTIIPGQYYYLSMQSESQGLINVGFPNTRLIVYPDTIVCQPYYLFVTNTNKINDVHKYIIDFYAGVDTNFIYYCTGVTPCE